MSDWKYAVTAFAGTTHKTMPYGVMVGCTTHRTEGSMEIEVATYQDRMAKREIVHVDVTRLFPPFGTQRLYYGKKYNVNK